MPEFDRAAEDIGNIVGLEHVNTRVPDQQLAVAFYIMGLGLTRDPYLVTGTVNMWVNVGRSQFHLPTGQAQVLRGHTGLVIPGRSELLNRLKLVKDQLQGTQFSFAEAEDHVAVTCPWGNQIRCYEPNPQFPGLNLGMPYVQLDVPAGSAAAIARFYQVYLGAPSQVREIDSGLCASVVVGADQELRFAERSGEQSEFDGHHIAIYIADFSGPHGRLLKKGLITQESNQHQYRFVDIVDPANGAPVFKLEHEVRSMRHPLYGRAQINRNPAITNITYATGHEDMAWAVMD